MPEIMTVCGPIAPEELGFTSMHEHILWDGRVYRQKYEAMLPDGLPVAADDPVTLENVSLLEHCFIMSWDACSMHDEELMTAEVADFKASGGILALAIRSFNSLISAVCSSSSPSSFLIAFICSLR